MESCDIADDEAKHPGCLPIPIKEAIAAHILEIIADDYFDGDVAAVREWVHWVSKELSEPDSPLTFFVENCKSVGTGDDGPVRGLGAAAAGEGGSTVLHRGGDEEDHRDREGTA